MESGAIIAAAGMSSRMGEFKPMLHIGSISIAERIIANFQQAGVTKIVMVTGYNATALERHLAKKGVVFLRNENYESTQMFDSAKIGLAYLRDKCDRILFTPVDIPLFTARTVSALLACTDALVCPVCEGKRGHPILITAELVDRLLADTGEQGLQGAMARCGVKIRELAVDDSGILHDADTPEDYRQLLRQHNSQLVRPEVSAALAKEKLFFDRRIAMLLRLVDETASVRAACQRMQISYSAGWNLIRTLESQCQYTLIERSQGGAGGSRSRLTDEGKELLRRYDGFERELRGSADELFDKYFEGVFR